MDETTTSMRVLIGGGEQYVSTSDLIAWLRVNARRGMRRPDQAPELVFDLLADELICFQYEPFATGGAARPTALTAD